MKYIPLFVLALFLGSCSSKPIITLEMQNHTEADWILVSVRDSSVVLLAPYEEIGKGIAFTHAVVIPTRSISRIILHKQGSFLSRIPLALFGAGTGLALKACNCDDRIYHIVIGGVIGYNLSIIKDFIDGLKEDRYFPWLESDRDRLRQKAVFPVEPEIMKYVR
ncbi:MAG: hypothetical protein ACHQM6_03295 [Candidatus Kapaibacterium sp.]